MTTREQNDFLTLTGPGTPMGDLMRRYWIPALLSSEIPEPDGPPVRVKLLGEKSAPMGMIADKLGHGAAPKSDWTASLPQGKRKAGGSGVIPKPPAETAATGVSRCPCG